MIKVEHLYKGFDGVQVLKDISVEYKPGMCNMIIGASGSGKTVLLKNLIGLMEPDGGQIYYGDKALTQMSYEQKRQLRQKIGFLFQGSALFDFATVTIMSAEQTVDSVMLDTFVPEKGKKYAVVFGNEVAGVRQDVVDASDMVLEIPQYGTKHSLNVSVSMGVILWHLRLMIGK